jgi:hypothetical protein
MKIYAKRKIAILILVIALCFAFISVTIVDVFPLGSLLFALLFIYFIIIFKFALFNLFVSAQNGCLILSLPKRFRAAAFNSFSVTGLQKYSIPLSELISVSLVVPNKFCKKDYQLEITRTDNKVIRFETSIFNRSELEALLSKSVPGKIKKQLN